METKETRKYNDEIQLDDMLDIIKYRVLDINEEAKSIEYPLIWYINTYKTEKTKYETKEAGKTVKKSSIDDIVSDYGISPDNWKLFNAAMNCLPQNVYLAENLDSTNKTTNFIITMENSYRYALSILGIEANNKTLGFFYGFLLKVRCISILEATTIKDADKLDSVMTNAVLFMCILKNIDKDNYNKKELYPDLDKSEKLPVAQPPVIIEVKDEPVVEAEPVKEEVIPEKKSFNKKNIIITTNKQVAKPVENSNQGNTLRRYIEPNIDTIKILDTNRDYNYRIVDINKKRIDLLEVYNNIITNKTSIALLSRKYNCVNQTVRNQLNKFCELNNIPRPRQGVCLYSEAMDVAKNIEAEEFKKKQKEEQEDLLFKKATEQNLELINSAKKSTTFFPSQIEGLKEEITGAKNKQSVVRRFINKPIVKNKGVVLKLTPAQLELLANGSNWFTLNDGLPYFVTMDGKIWRNKPTEADLKSYGN